MWLMCVEIVVNGGKGRWAERARQVAESRVRREPPPLQRFLHCIGFQTAGGLRGRLRWCHIRELAARPASRRRRLVTEAGGMAGRNRLKDVAGVRYRGGEVRRHPDDTVASVADAVSGKPRFFWERTRASRSVFPEGVLGSEKLKTHFRVEVGFGCRSSGAPQFFHFPCAAAARFVIVTWVICQVATDCCGRAKPRWQLGWSALAEELCREQFMEIGICGKCANSVWSLNGIGTSPF